MRSWVLCQVVDSLDGLVDSLKKDRYFNKR
jgi:hypothetical protein